MPTPFLYNFMGRTRETLNKSSAAERQIFCSQSAHQKLIRNLVSVLANKILIFNDKITHVGKRTTRDKLLSYLSAESTRHSSLSFDIPFDRQQLADYLCIDRAAMSTEISRLQKEGILKTNRNHFELTVCNSSTSEKTEAF